MTATGVWVLVAVGYVVFGFVAFRFIWAMRVAPLPDGMPEDHAKKLMRQRRQWSIQGRSGPFLFVAVLPDFIIALIMLPLLALGMVIACVRRPRTGLRRLGYIARYGRYPPPDGTAHDGSL